MTRTPVNSFLHVSNTRRVLVARVNGLNADNGIMTANKALRARNIRRTMKTAPITIHGLHRADAYYHMRFPPHHPVIQVRHDLSGMATIHSTDYHRHNHHVQQSNMTGLA